MKDTRSDWLIQTAATSEGYYTSFGSCYGCLSAAYEFFLEGMGAVVWFSRVRRSRLAHLALTKQKPDLWLVISLCIYLLLSAYLLLSVCLHPFHTISIFPFLLHNTWTTAMLAAV